MIRARPTRPHPCGANTLRGLSNLPYRRRQLFHRGLTAGWHPTFVGCGQFDMHGTYCKFEQGWFAYLYGHAITKQRPFSHAPRACGVLPCIKPTVKTVGASTHTCSPRNAAEWRCGLAPRHAPLRGMLPPIIPYHSAGGCQHQRREKWQAGFWLPFFKLLRRFVTFSQFPALSYTPAPRISLPISGEKKRAAGGVRSPVWRLFKLCYSPGPCAPERPALPSLFAYWFAIRSICTANIVLQVLPPCLGSRATIELGCRG